jgi:predicted dehydrogenase
MTYRAALIGCGKVGSEFADDPRAADAGIYTHAAAYVACPATRLVAVCDLDPAKADRCATRWNAKSYHDPGRMLAEERPEIVSVCTPDSTHYAVVRAALMTDSVRGVLAEKPLALSLNEAEELVTLARSRKVALAVNYSRRYADSHVRLRDTLRSGRVGTIRLIRGLYTKGTLHNGSHWFDLVRFLAGEATAVHAIDRLQEGGADPTLDVRLILDNGTTAELAAWPAEEFTVFEMDVLGSRGRVRVANSGSMVELHEVADGVPYAGYRSLVLTRREEGAFKDVLLHSVEDLVECIKTGAMPRCSGADGVAALRIALAARESAVAGTTIPIAQS